MRLSLQGIGSLVHFAPSFSVHQGLEQAVMHEGRQISRANPDLCQGKEVLASLAALYHW